MRINTLAEHQDLTEKAQADPEAFWESLARTFTWFEPWTSCLDWDFSKPSVRWFDGGQLNITVNCLDRHLAAKGDKVALFWQPNESEKEPLQLTYADLAIRVNQAARGLRELGVQKGDRVCFYMGMVPELLIGVLACARIGAIHSVVFAGFSAQALGERIDDAACRWVLCSDWNPRGPKTHAVKDVVDEALLNYGAEVESVVVVRRTGGDVAWNSDRDVWWDELIDLNNDWDEPAEVMDAEDPLFILYTSGSTGKPKGVVHTTAGYMIYTQYSFENVFQLDEEDIFWCTADIGWITGHSYVAYGPLLAGATIVLFEGTPSYPSPSRFWDVCAEFGVTHFYTAPTAIRALMAEGNHWLEKADLSSLKVLGTVGEPINQEAWEWYHNKIGKGRLPIVDTWWQTETGGIMISNLAGVTPAVPTKATLPLPGIQPCLLDEAGKELEGEAEGFLCIRFPWPSILRTTWGDHERCRSTYFERFPNYYFTGDGAQRDGQGYYRIIGRVDDVINISGHRIGTAEVEDAIDESPHVVEAAVVGYPHEIKGEALCAFVISQGDKVDFGQLTQELRSLVAQKIGAIARPDKIIVVSALPKTRSGKIMRRILRELAKANNADLGDTSTLLNPDSVEDIKNEMAKQAH